MTLGLERPTTAGAGDLLRAWRLRRRLGQLDLACLADVSTCHLSYVETGRSRPSRQFVLHVCEHLDVPLRERNDLLVAAGYAPSTARGELSSFTTAATFGTAADVMLSELTVEQCFPADTVTDEAVRRSAG